MNSRPRWIDTPPDDTDPVRFADMTADERLQYFVQACELAHALLRGREDFSEVLARRSPLSPESEKVWLRLVAEGRRARAA
jgi:hypothetical protein